MVVVRTVVDFRSGRLKFLQQLLLLVASWHRFGQSSSVLEVYVVGSMEDKVNRFVESLGAKLIFISPNTNTDFSNYSNKISGCMADPEGRRVLLVDNDTVLLNDLSFLETRNTKAICGSVCGHIQVKSQQWPYLQDCIRSATGVELLRRNYVPLNDLGVQAKGDHEIESNGLQERFLYLNSGVLLFPSGYNFRPLWEEMQRVINNYFLHHPLRNFYVSACDQAALAAAIAVYGKFEWLPIRFNYRHGAIRLGLAPASDVRILHMTGDVHDGDSLTLRHRVLAYWCQFIDPKLSADLKNLVGQVEYERRCNISDELRSKVLSVVDGYDFENLDKSLSV